MVSVEEALQLVDQFTDIAPLENSSLINSYGNFLGEDLYSPIDLPSFRNSAMDGYAILLSDYEKGIRSYELVGEIQAGDTTRRQLKPNQAFRIFTGAATPDNCDLVIMQERAERNGNSVVFENGEFKPFHNIRQIGEQVLKGQLALEKGTPLNAATIGYLASLGFSNINCARRPKIAIVSSGNELKRPGEDLEFGQIFESNSFALIAHLSHHGFDQVTFKQMSDSYSETLEKIQSLVNEVDFLILSGGISVGEYDFVGRALRELKTKEAFYKVKQKPGKPLFFGRNGKCHVFALPGNPAAALTCLHIYVLSSLRKFMGGLNVLPEEILLPVTNDYVKKGYRAQFLKASVERDGVKLLEGQSSNMMHTFAVANAMVYLDQNSKGAQKGEMVRVIRFA